MNMRTFLLLLTAILVSLCSHSDDTVKVEALFTNKAMLVINGERHLMSAGQTVEEITLISAHGRGARIRFADGEERLLGLNQLIGHSFVKPKRSKVEIYPTEQGMYLLAGSINGRASRFLVDTGATYVSLSEEEAQSLGIEYKSAAKVRIETASDIVSAWLVTLDRVSVDDIAVTQVNAVILPGAAPTPALLGMSFLRHVTMQRKGVVMQLEQKY